MFNSSYSSECCWYSSFCIWPMAEVMCDVIKLFCQASEAASAVDPSEKNCYSCRPATVFLISGEVFSSFRGYSDFQHVGRQNQQPALATATDTFLPLLLLGHLSSLRTKPGFGEMFQGLLAILPCCLVFSVVNVSIFNLISPTDGHWPVGRPHKQNLRQDENLVRPSPITM